MLVAVYRQCLQVIAIAFHYIVHAFVTKWDFLTETTTSEDWLHGLVRNSVLNLHNERNELINKLIIINVNGRRTWSASTLSNWTSWMNCSIWRGDVWKTRLGANWSGADWNTGCLVNWTSWGVGATRWRWATRTGACAIRSGAWATRTGATTGATRAAPGAATVTCADTGTAALTWGAASGIPSCTTINSSINQLIS